ncbi:MAG TPA: hypothetical protein VH575_04035 [Gemmataceae bacterium]|jgi:hypothetical protein
MTLSDYIDLARFPLTTQRGLSPKNQLLIDAVNFDLLREFLEEGGLPTESQRRRWDEFREKMKHHAVLTEECSVETLGGGAYNDI